MVLTAKDILVKSFGVTNWRLATRDDSDILFHWRNDPIAIKYSKSGRAVTWEEHTTWLSGVLLSNSTLLLVAEVEGVALATSRFDLYVPLPNAYVISINIDAGHRGHGIGLELLQTVISLFLSALKADLIADIHRENLPSERLFKRAGFKFIQSDGDFNRMMLKPRSQSNIFPILDIF